MKYLVIGSGGPGFASPEDELEVLQNVVLPSFAEFVALEKKKVINGGLPIGDRAFVFIAEAESNEALDRMLRKVPMWGALDWEVTPLQTFAGREKLEKNVAKKLTGKAKNK